MKRAVLIVLGFGVISIGLTWIWNEWAQLAYGHFLAAIGPPIYDLIGFEDARMAALRERYINFVPFVSLVLVTPGITLRRRTIGLAMGLVAISASHLALNLTGLLQPGGVALPIVAALVSDALPFLVWLVVAYPVVVKFLPSLSEPKPEPEPTDADAAQ
jgi:hypothetical protein